MSMNKEIVLSALAQNAVLCEKTLYLALPQQLIAIKSNHVEIIQALTQYFKVLVTQSTIKKADIEIHVYEGEALTLDIIWQDWSREAGKVGRKDAFYDVDATARLIYKVRTGMLFLQSQQELIASGPCLANMNQVINFVNNQYINHLQQQDWLICHAAALAFKAKDGCYHAIAFAGFSGGGKSTSMLHLLDDERLHFLSNDRIFIKSIDAAVHIAGIPKQPRVNPGTLLNNAKLKTILTETDEKTFSALTREELWDIEHKYDVDIAQTYGENRTTYAAQLDAFVVLNWDKNSTAPTKVEHVDIQEKPHLLAAIMKASGPFYQYANGQFDDNQQAPTADPYLALLSKNVSVIEASGRVDFEVLRAYCQQHLLKEA